MTFIIKKTSSSCGKTRKLYYLVENYREDNKIKRVTQIKMGENKSIVELLGSMEREEKELLDILHRSEKLLDDFIKYNIAPKIMSSSPYKVRKALDWSVENAKNELEECRNKIRVIRTFM